MSEGEHPNESPSTSDQPGREPSAPSDETPSTSDQPSRSITKQFKYNRVELPTPEQIMQIEAMNNCIVRALMAGLGGLVLGGAFGVVMGAMDTSSMDTGSLDPKKQKTTLQVLRETARTTKDRSVSYGKAFSTIGLLYSGVDCVVEKYRGRHDIYNSLYSGCITGSLLARSSGPLGICGGCASFAVFSALMDRFMGSH